MPVGATAINNIVRLAPFNYISALVPALRLLIKPARRLRIPRKMCAGIESCLLRASRNAVSRGSRGLETPFLEIPVLSVRAGPCICSI